MVAKSNDALRLMTDVFFGYRSRRPEDKGAVRERPPGRYPAGAAGP